ncbi:uncharacterized protein LOC141831767 [Curcuma longa]|uniref:uncharacterized protein LOC141831767 n=1 Tax=Curcuma longa TaxID=136217 RepID=UPI003D9E3300
MEEPNLSIQSFHQGASLISVKLSTTNYLMWRSQILSLARSLGVFHHLEKDGWKPPAEIEKDGKKISNTTYASWSINDGLITSWLLSTMREDMQGSIEEIGSACSLWTSLEEQLLPTTIEKEGLLKNMLMTIKKGSRSIDEYLKDFKSICDNLAAIKKSVPDLDKVFQFARGLGPKYETFRLAMVTKPPYPTFNQFVLALQGHEQILQIQRDEERVYVEHAQAFFGQRGRGRNNRGGRGSFNSKGRGFTLQQQPSSNKSTGKIACQICGKYNHGAIDCWHRFDYSYQSEDLPQALAALTLRDGDPSFYADSGASSHMTNDADLASALCGSKAEEGRKAAALVFTRRPEQVQGGFGRRALASSEMRRRRKEAELRGIASRGRGEVARAGQGST